MYVRSFTLCPSPQSNPSRYEECSHFIDEDAKLSPATLGHKASKQWDEDENQGLSDGA